MTEQITKKSTKISILYTLLQYIYWMINCSIYSFAAMFFLYNNFQNKDIGILLALANIVSIILQPYISQIVITKMKIPVKHIIFILNALLCLFIVILLLINPKQYVLVILYSISLIIILTLQPFINSLGFEYINNGLKINFGISRGAGSLSFALTSYIVGILLAKFTPNALPIFVLVSALLLFLPLLLLPKVVNNKVENKEESTVNLKMMLQKYPFLLYLGIGFSCLFIFHTLVSTFITQIMMAVGGNSKNIGTALMIAGFCELPAMIFFSKLVKIKNSIFWVNISTIFFFIRSIALIFASTIMQVQGTQLLQALSFALFIPASAYLINEKMSHIDSVFGQTIITSSMALGGIIGSIFGGILLDSFGINSLLIFGSVAAFLGFLMTYLGLKKI